MFTSLIAKTFDIYTAPVRFAYRLSVKQLDTARKLAQDIQVFRDEFKMAEREAQIVFDGLLHRVASDLEQIPEDLTLQEQEQILNATLNRAEYLLTEAAVELIKGFALMIKPALKSLPGNMGNKSSERHQIIEGEILN